MLCNFCSKSITLRGFKNHLIGKHSTEFSNINDLTLFVLKHKNNWDDEVINNITKDYEELSILQLSKKYAISYGHILTLFKALNIGIRGIKDTCFLDKVKELKVSTTFERYGVDNVSKSEEIKNKKKSTFLKNYGVDNIFKDPTFIKELDSILMAKYGVKRLCNIEKQKETIKNKPKEFFNERTKKSNITRNKWSDEKRQSIKDKKSKTRKELWNKLSSKEKDTILEKLAHNTISSLEVRVAKCLTELNISYESQYLLSYRYFDFKVNKVLIEINGDYWHANPEKYSANDIISFPKGKKILASSLWKKDEVKKRAAEKKGFTVFYIWEKELNTMTDLELKKRILNLLLN